MQCQGLAVVIIQCQGRTVVAVGVVAAGVAVAAAGVAVVGVGVAVVVVEHIEVGNVIAVIARMFVVLVSVLA